MNKLSLLVASAITLVASPVLALNVNQVVNTPVSVVDTQNHPLKKTHVDVTDSSNNVQVHAVRMNGKSNLRWKGTNTVDSSNPATASVQVRVGGHKAAEITCPDVSLMDKNGNQINSVTFTVDAKNKSCATSTN